MNKKGTSLSIETVVVVVIALLVLIVVGYIFSTQISQSTKQYVNVSKSMETEIKLKSNCEELFSTKKCMPLETCNIKGLINIGSDWKDCKAKSTPGHVLYCCKS